MNTAFNAMGTALRRIGQIAIGALIARGITALGQASAQAAREASDLGANLVETARLAGTSISTFRQLQRVFEGEGVSEGALATSLIQAQRRFAENTPKLQESIQAIGISLEEWQDTGGNVERIFFLLAEAMEGTATQAQKMAALQETLGRSGTELFRVLSLGSDSLREQVGLYRDEAEALERVAPRLKEYNQLLTDIRREQEASRAELIGTNVESYAGLARAFGDIELAFLQLGRALAPVATHIAGLVEDLAEAITLSQRFPTEQDLRGASDAELQKTIDLAKETETIWQRILRLIEENWLAIVGFASALIFIHPVLKVVAGLFGRAAAGAGRITAALNRAADRRGGAAAQRAGDRSFDEAEVRVVIREGETAEDAMKRVAEGIKGAFDESAAAATKARRGWDLLGTSIRGLGAAVAWTVRQLEKFSRFLGSRATRWTAWLAAFGAAALYLQDLWRNFGQGVDATQALKEQERRIEEYSKTVGQSISGLLQSSDVAPVGEGIESLVQHFKNLSNAIDDTVPGRSNDRINNFLIDLQKNGGAAVERLRAITQRTEDLIRSFKDVDANQLGRTNKFIDPTFIYQATEQVDLLTLSTRKLLEELRKPERGYTGGRFDFFTQMRDAAAEAADRLVYLREQYEKLDERLEIDATHVRGGRDNRFVRASNYPLFGDNELTDLNDARTDAFLRDQEREKERREEAARILALREMEFEVLRKIHSEIQGIIFTESGGFAGRSRLARDMESELQGRFEAEEAHRQAVADKIRSILDRLHAEMDATARATEAAFRTAAEGIAASMGEAVAQVVLDFQNLRDTVGNLLRSILQQLAQLYITRPIANALTNLIPLPGRQFGGPTYAGQPYIVGEAGRELFVPGSDGYVFPIKSGQAAGGVTVNFAPVINSTDGPGVERALQRALPDYVRIATDAAKGRMVQDLGRRSQTRRIARSR